MYKRVPGFIEGGIVVDDGECTAAEAAAAAALVEAEEDEADEKPGSDNSMYRKRLEFDDLELKKPDKKRSKYEKLFVCN